MMLLLNEKEGTAETMLDTCMIKTRKLSPGLILLPTGELVID